MLLREGDRGWGLQNDLIVFRSRDTGYLLNNGYILSLYAEGNDVAIGKNDNREVDFIATKSGEKKRIQVTESIRSGNVRKRELVSLQKYGTMIKNRSVS